MFFYSLDAEDMFLLCIVAGNDDVGALKIQGRLSLVDLIGRRLARLLVLVGDEALAPHYRVDLVPGPVGRLLRRALPLVLAHQCALELVVARASRLYTPKSKGCSWIIFSLALGIATLILWVYYRCVCIYTRLSEARHFFYALGLTAKSFAMPVVIIITMPHSLINEMRMYVVYESIRDTRRWIVRNSDIFISH